MGNHEAGYISTTLCLDFHHLYNIKDYWDSFEWFLHRDSDVS
jgi:hypothetical protein